MIISERIFYVMEQKNITQLELSRRTGIATSNISDWKKKKTNPKADCLLSICDALDITPEQLLTGKGIDPEYKDADMDYEVTRADIKILKQIHSLGDEQYKRLMAYIKALQKLKQMGKRQNWFIIVEHPVRMQGRNFVPSIRLQKPQLFIR